MVLIFQAVRLVIHHYEQNKTLFLILDENFHFSRLQILNIVRIPLTSPAC